LIHGWAGRWTWTAPGQSLAEANEGPGLEVASKRTIEELTQPPMVGHGGDAFASADGGSSTPGQTVGWTHQRLPSGTRNMGGISNAGSGRGRNHGQPTLAFGGSGCWVDGSPTTSDKRGFPVGLLRVSWRASGGRRCAQNGRGTLFGARAVQGAVRGALLAARCLVTDSQGLHPGRRSGLGRSRVYGAISAGWAPTIGADFLGGRPEPRRLVGRWCLLINCAIAVVAAVAGMILDHRGGKVRGRTFIRHSPGAIPVQQPGAGHPRVRALPTAAKDPVSGWALGRDQSAISWRRSSPLWSRCGSASGVRRGPDGLPMRIGLDRNSRRLVFSPRCLLFGRTVRDVSCPELLLSQTLATAHSRGGAWRSCLFAVGKKHGHLGLVAAMPGARGHKQLMLTGSIWPHDRFWSPSPSSLTPAAGARAAGEILMRSRAWRWVFVPLSSLRAHRGEWPTTRRRGQAAGAQNSTAGRRRPWARRCEHLLCECGSRPYGRWPHPPLTGRRSNRSPRIHGG